MSDTVTVAVVAIDIKDDSPMQDLNAVRAVDRRQLLRPLPLQLMPTKPRSAEARKALRGVTRVALCSDFFGG